MTKAGFQFTGQLASRHRRRKSKPHSKPESVGYFAIPVSEVGLEGSRHTLVMESVCCSGKSKNDFYD